MKLLQFPTCWPMNGLSIHWSRGWGVLSFSECFVPTENVWISIKISLKFVPMGTINNIPALVQIMAWRRPGDKPLSEPMMVRLPIHICVIRPQWVTINTISMLRKMIKKCKLIFACFLKTIQNNKVGLILGIGSANQRRRYNVTSSLIGWPYTQNDSCKGY